MKGLSRKEESAAQPKDLSDRLIEFSRMAGMALIVLGAAILLIWLLALGSFGGVSSALLSVNPTTAIMILVCSLALRLACQEDWKSRATLRICAAIGLALALLGFASLMGQDMGGDHLLFRSQLIASFPHLKVTPSASLIFLLDSIALLALDFEMLGYSPAEFLSMGGFALALMTLAGYGYGVQPLMLNHASADLVELNVAFSYCVLSLGILCARPRRGMMALALAEDPGGETVRYLLPAVVIVPTILAWVRMLAQQTGLYNSNQGSALFAAASLLIYIALIWWNAVSLHKASQERQWAQRRVEEAQQSKAEFVVGVSHELRSALSPIRMGLSMAQMESPALSERQQKFVGISVNSIDRLVRLIGEIIDYHKVESGHNFQMKTTDLGGIVAETLQVFVPAAKEKGLELILLPTAALPPVVADRDRISQVVVNLLSNAIKFTARGRVTVSIEALPDRFQKVIVHDEGPGIEAVDHVRLFKTFSQLSNESSAHSGSGLGLAISRKIVERHGGRIGLSSKLGEGSAFFFALPPAAAA